MGSRANYVVVDDQGWQLFYSHWGAQHVDVQLAPGPEYALRFITSQQPCDASHWLDDRWCEGGALVDTDARQLRFFGGFEFLHGLNYRRAYFALLEQTWPGWNISWAHDGLADLAAYVGVDSAEVRVAELSLSRRVAVPSALALASDEDLNEGFWALLTMRCDGRVVGWPIDNRYVDPKLVWIGTGMVDLLPEPHTGSLVISGQPPQWGIHVDRVAQQVGWWATAKYPGLQSETPHRWPGWDVHFWQDRYEQHRAVCGGTVRTPDIDHAQGFNDLADRLGVRSNPVAQALEVVGSLRKSGYAVEVNPSISSHVEVDPSNEEQRQLAVALSVAREQRLRDR